MGIVTKFFKIICASVVVFIGVLLGPDTLPGGAKFGEFRVEPTRNFGDVLAPNEVLNNAERLFENEIKGPESFEVVNGELYTCLHGGFVAKVFDDQIVPVVKFGEPCVGWWEESKCGRPLAIKALGNDHLIIADAYFGIYKYNINTRKFTNLVDKNTVIDGKKPKTFNGVEVGRDGSIYWTHSSSDFGLEDSIFIFLADGSGRLLKYDPKTQKNTVLMKDLYYANGVVLSPEEDFLLVAESGHSRIHKYYLEGPKKFQSEIFVDGLPGVPDNLRSNGRGGFFVPLVTTRDENAPVIFQVISPFPKLRKFAARILSYTELTLNKIHEIYPNYLLQRIIHYVGHLESANLLLPVKTTILEMDVKGNVIASYHGNDGSVSSISDVIIHNGYLYLGSYVNNYLGRVHLSKLGGKFSGGWVKPSAPVLSTIPPSAPTQKPPPPTTRAPPPTTRPPPPTTRPPPPTTTTPPPTTRAPPPTTTKPTTRAPPPTTRPPPPSTTRAPPATRPPPPTTTPKPPPPPTTTPKPPPPPTTSKPATQAPNSQSRDNMNAQKKSQPNS